MGLGLPPSKIIHLCGKGSQLSHPLSELGDHVPMQRCLIDEAVLVLLMFAKEPGFLPATSNKRLKKDGDQNTNIDEERRGREVGLSEYPIDGNINVS